MQTSAASATMTTTAMQRTASDTATTVTTIIATVMSTRYQQPQDIDDCKTMMTARH